MNESKKKLYFNVIVGCSTWLIHISYFIYNDDILKFKYEIKNI